MRAEKSCEDWGMYPITDREDCFNAATMLDLTFDRMVDNEDDPEKHWNYGCSWWVEGRTVALDTRNRGFEFESDIEQEIICVDDNRISCNLNYHILEIKRETLGFLRARFSLTRHVVCTC